jgi:hypothetical protein
MMTRTEQQRKAMRKFKHSADNPLSPDIKEAQKKFEAVFKSVRRPSTSESCKKVGIAADGATNKHGGHLRVIKLKGEVVARDYRYQKHGCFEIKNHGVIQQMFDFIGMLNGKA